MLGIIGAMDEEVAKLKETMQDVAVETKASMEFYKGTMNGKEVVVVRSGIGKVNAGICTQILCDLYHVDAVINTGIAGSLNAKIDIGDIVLSTDALQHDMAKECCERVNPDIHVFEGRVVSGDQFISDKAKKEFILNTFAGDCTEMEGAAIAQAAYLNQIPFLIIRAISDKADDSATEDYPTFETKAIAHSVKLVQAIVAGYANA